MERMRRAGVETARHYTWDHIIEILLRRLQHMAVKK